MNTFATGCQGAASIVCSPYRLDLTHPRTFPTAINLQRPFPYRTSKAFEPQRGGTLQSPTGLLSG
jgi:hypothetical protein